MNGWEYLSILTLLSVVALALLGVLAYAGDVWAGVVLGGIGAIVLVAIGWILAMAQNSLHERAKARAFQENAAENLALMNSQFRALSSMAHAQGRVAGNVQRENLDLRRLLGDGSPRQEESGDYFEIDDAAMSRMLSDMGG